MPQLSTPISTQGHIYTLETELGYGKYSTVYQGQQKDTPLHKPKYAIKIPHIAATRKLRQTLVTFEAEFFQQINHPNFIRYIDHSLDIRTPYLVMDIVPETIDDKIKKKTITPNVITEYLTQIPAITQQLQQHNLIHGDLRSKNIAYKNNTFIVLDPLPAICRTNPDTRKIPQDYAPEIKNGAFSLAADIFSLGKTLEYMLDSLPKTSPHIHSSLQNLTATMTHPQSNQRPTPPQLQELCQQTLAELKEKYSSQRKSSKEEDATLWTIQKSNCNPKELVGLLYISKEIGYA